MTDAANELRAIAPVLERLRPDPDAVVSYDLFSDGLRWSDEAVDPPVTDLSEYACLRTLWRFRMSLVLGRPQEEHRAFWDAAKKAFPGWPGFLPERQHPVLRGVYLGLSREALSEWGRLGEDRVGTRETASVGKVP